MKNSSIKSIEFKLFSLFWQIAIEEEVFFDFSREAPRA